MVVGQCDTGQARLSTVADAGVVPADMVDRGGCDAARRSGVPVDKIEIVGATAETWPDSSLGCPVPGQGGADVNTDGYRLVLRAGERSYDYRAERRTDGRQMLIRLCEQ